jgi:hypothetical protein
MYTRQCGDVLPIPQSRERNLALIHAYPELPTQSEIPCYAPPKVASFPRSLSPRRRGAGIQFLPDMDPRFRGGDVWTFISMGGPVAHSE